jgi:uncharacterized OB-fold protein
MSADTDAQQPAPPVPRPQPVPDPDSQGFWEATANGEIAIRRCQECGLWSHLPLERCRECAGATAFETVSGDGTLYSFIVVHQNAVPGFSDDLPYVVGMVDLVEQEGLRLVTKIDDVAPSELEIGQPMRARVVAHPGGDYFVPVFSPVGQD